MKCYQICEDGLLIKDTSSFNPAHIFECGQVFSYEKKDDVFYSFPQDKLAIIRPADEGYFIETKDIEFFINYLDLDRDYENVKNQLLQFPILKEAINFGSGIRILNQDIFETVISFIISANNNIKRIQLILNNLRKALGKSLGQGFYAFPEYSELKQQDENFFKQMGTGYRAKYLKNVLNQICPEQLKEWAHLPTKSLREKLLGLSGVGPKVADCILLFGFKRQDVFPVDTWIYKCYNHFYTPLNNRETIRQNLVKEFGSLSGYAQQYLFYYQRDFIKH